MEEDLSDLRVSYELGTLDESSVKKNPIEQFKDWYDQVSNSHAVREPNAMILCTASKDGIPSGRPLLLKSFDEEGFIFYTNYNSRKSNDIKENPRASIVFYWEPFERTVRIEGVVEMVSEDQSTHYFHSRPKGSQIGAWASPHQSGVVRDRDEITQRYQEVEKKFEGLEEIPKPEFWGGWRVRPLAIEFWQGRKCRLHDRIYFSRENVDSKEWKMSRLSP